MPDAQDQNQDIPQPIEPHLAAVRALCAKHQVQRLDLIGSAATGRFDQETSDLDFVVEFRAGLSRQGLRDPYFQLKHELEDLFERQVDLIEFPAIRSPEFKEEVQQTRTRLYAA